MRKPIVGETIRITKHLRNGVQPTFEARLTSYQDLTKDKNGLEFYYVGYTPFDAMRGAWGYTRFYPGSKPEFADVIELTEEVRKTTDWRPFCPKPGDVGYDLMC